MLKKIKNNALSIVSITYLLAMNGGGFYFLSKYCFPLFLSAIHDLQNGTVGIEILLRFALLSFGMFVAISCGFIFAVIICAIVFYLIRRIIK